MARFDPEINRPAWEAFVEKRDEDRSVFVAVMSALGVVYDRLGSVPFCDVKAEWTEDGWSLSDLHALYVELGDLFGADAESPKQLIETIREVVEGS